MTYFLSPIMPTLNPTTSSLDRTPYSKASPNAINHPAQTVGTLVFIEEFKHIKSLHDAADNHSPKFSCTDLISACISLTFALQRPEVMIFTYLHTELLLRNPKTQRRPEEIWKPQYDLLLTLQRSRMNSHPNPHFTLDHFTTACIAIVIRQKLPSTDIYSQARRNTAARVATRKACGFDNRWR